MSLDKYNLKRDFSQTSEPKGVFKPTTKDHIFVVQKHHASQLHYDFRLQYNGVLVSWAIPKGPSLNPDEKRLAVQTEDHPLDYASFEGNIPEKNYGAGDVIVWDTGIYFLPIVKTFQEMEDMFKEMYEKGHLSFVLEGEKLKGEFALIKTHFGKQNSWLLIKAKDTFASTKDITKENTSVLSDKKL